MKPFLLLTALSVACSSLAVAQTRNVYDWRSGNSYTITQQPNGAVNVYGNNFSTGSNWNIQQQPNGTYFGQDARGNMFQGNNTTGYYQNFGTGRTCFGTGPGRVCN